MRIEESGLRGPTCQACQELRLNRYRIGLNQE
jgi:hypothetical protein